MKRICALILCCFSLASCAGKSELNPDFKAQLESHERLAARFEQADRTIFKMEVGDQAVTLPPGVKFIVNAPPPEPVYPAMFRDYTREAELHLLGNILNNVIRVGSSGLFGWLGQREDRKMLEGFFTSRQGIDFRSAGDINFSGGIGDDGQRGYSTSSTETTTTSTVTPAPVINQPVIVPSVVTPMVTPPVVTPPVVVPPVFRDASPQSGEQ